MNGINERVYSFYGVECQECTGVIALCGWQFKDKQVCNLFEKGKCGNLFNLIDWKSERCYWKNTNQSMDAQFVLDY